MNKLKRTGLGVLLVGSTLAGGAAFGTTMVGSASAASDTSVTATAPQNATAPPSGSFDPSKGGHTANGITETVLTGDDATKAKAAALAAVPGATVQRAETDAEGAKYEVHILKSDGTPATVKLDENFKVTGVETGGPGGQGGPSDNSASSTTGV